MKKITCIILRNLFGLDLFSHQSCATGTLLLQKKIYPRKSSLNLKQLIFSCSLIWEMVVRHQSNFFFHIRSKADAYYEPWSKAITGESGNEGYMA